MKYLTKTNDAAINTSVLLLRLVIGIILFVVGAGKLFGWFGGLGLNTTIQYYSKMGIPLLLTYLSIYVEFIGGLFLFLGLFTRYAAILVAINMLVAVILSIPGGFFPAAALPLVFLIDVIAILLIGPGRFAIDKFIKYKKY